MKFILDKRRAHRALVGGKDVIIFSSNDYLGLSAHPDVLRVAAEAAELYGVGTGGAPGTTGTTEVHEALRSAIAKFKSRNQASIFPSGYQANQALHHSLDSERTIFYVDNRHHPSALDGVRLAKNSRVVRFGHDNLNALKGAVQAHRGMTNIVTLPSVFTVDGDVAPLDRLFEMKQQLGFLIVLDEAHADGCIGKTGRGAEEHFNLKHAADFIMGTFSKAFGSQGGYVVYDDAVKTHLHSQFRAAEYSTSLSAVSAAAALKALELLEGDTAPMNSLRSSKQMIIENCLARDVPIIFKESMIMLVPGNDCDALQARLFDTGYLTTVVKASVDGNLVQSLRITPMATHSKEEITGFTEALKKNL